MAHFLFFFKRRFLKKKKIYILFFSRKFPTTVFGTIGPETKQEASIKAKL